MGALEGRAGDDGIREDLFHSFSSHGRQDDRGLIAQLDRSVAHLPCGQLVSIREGDVEFDDIRTFLVIHGHFEVRGVCAPADDSIGDCHVTFAFAGHSVTGPLADLKGHDGGGAWTVLGCIGLLV